MDVAEEGYLSGACSAFCPVSLGMDRWFVYDAEGTVAAAELTLEWTAENPTTERLKVMFGQLEREDQSQYMEVYEELAGTSPLTLDLDGLDWQNDEYVVAVWWDNSQPGAVNLSQGFSVTGTLSGAR